MLSNCENDRLFAKSVPISLKNVLTDQTRTCNLFLTIEWRQDASAGMYSKKVLALSLTDDNDPFFLFNLELTEEEFETLKTSQGLLINFASFPQQIIELIEKCLLAEKNPQPKFLLVFTTKFGNNASSSQFDIIETNQFKHLTHLTLKFVSATESEIRKYIASCFGVLKENKKHLEKSLAFSEQDKIDKITALQRALSNTEFELETLKGESCAELTARDKKYEQQLKEEKNRWSKRLKEEQSRFEKERKEKEHNHQKEIQKLEQRENALDRLNKEIQDKNFNLESNIGSLRSKILSLEDEIRHLKIKIQGFQLKCDELNQTLKDKENHINEQAAVINNLQLESENKSKSIKWLNQKIANDKRSLEKELEKLEIQLDVHKKTIEEMEKDKDDSNRVIVNLQEKIQTAERNKKKNNDKCLQDIQTANDNLEKLLDAKNKKMESMTQVLKSYNEKIDYLDTDLKAQTALSDYLRKELYAHGIVPQASSPIASPSSIAQEKLTQISCWAGQHSPSPDYSPSVITLNKATPKSVRFSIWDN